MNIFSHAAELEKQNIPFALANIIETRGSTPRHSGQMIIKQDGSIVGTVGGGMIERHVIDQSIEAIQEGKARMVQGRMAQTGAQAMGMDCGGAMSVFVDVYGVRPRLILIGGGHVNRSIAHCANTLGFAVTVADNYIGSLDPQQFPEGTRLVLGDTMIDAIDKTDIDQNSYVVIATNHQDKDAICHVIEKPTFYTGLLASKRKVQTFFNSLRDNGISQDRLDKIHSPIGLNIGAETPEELAISVMAEVLKFKNQASGEQLKDDVRLQQDKLVFMRGAGDMATGVALRLHKAGFKVIMSDIEKPTVIRRTVAFAQAIFDQHSTVEGVTAEKANNLKETYAILERGNIPVLVDAEGVSLKALKPRFVVDAILAKQNLGTTKDMASITIALGPGFNAGVDCDAVIETNRGHHLGQIIYHGETQPNTGIPGSIVGYSHQRVMRAPVAGIFRSELSLGDLVNEGDLIAMIDETPIFSPLTGMIRGLLNNDLTVTEGFKVGDIDPRGVDADYTTASDKARAISGSVLEAMLTLEQQL
ncbi:EF2563 family selenium-dependent molybdenum hydroxylase system protein [Vibrio sp. SS-MA-C1-2]|uniref:selenium-dependent molybdenum cofactor biosynthesis protein YqeB n=1 Tax=Vibrio sp. SS-MA-C1-2 TaxID=2908646 RepID=UPI001F208CAD|nr:selenium-dependent molybdenum cofactor biosynthesis protein YqeB [Vibrio sp. SS-MA-C1-2]UJF18342.1 EF2563 family selenium-dependent molybdenum hydroxylase system protein [Vibrio sp. SS-MA-C1-2]